MTKCTIYNTSDDLFSISLASDNVTVSYCHFYFSASWMNMNPDPMWAWFSSTQFNDLANERICAVIGQNASDSYTYGGHTLHVTMHHNWFGPYMKGRPLCRGFIHSYNNYFDNTGKPSGTPVLNLAAHTGANMTAEVII